MADDVDIAGEVSDCEGEDPESIDIAEFKLTGEVFEVADTGENVDEACEAVSEIEALVFEPVSDVLSSFLKKSRTEVIGAVVSIILFAICCSMDVVVAEGLVYWDCVDCEMGEGRVWTTTVSNLSSSCCCCCCCWCRLTFNNCLRIVEEVDVIAKGADETSTTAEALIPSLEGEFDNPASLY